MDSKSSLSLALTRDLNDIKVLEKMTAVLQSEQEERPARQHFIRSGELLSDRGGRPCLQGIPQKIRR